MLILIADDESPKLSSVRSWLEVFAPHAKVIVSRSVRTTIDVLIEQRPSIVILDMSLPTFDVGAGESGGRPQGFGGIEVLRHIDFHGLSPKVIVVTQYEAFHDNGKQVDLTELAATLRGEHSGVFVDCIYYNAVSDDWKVKLGVSLQELMVA